MTIGDYKKIKQTHTFYYHETRAKKEEKKEKTGYAEND